ncbi:hypothetical protein [Brachybacterium sp.]|uniref:hypothetical protein n=1 Tax=Brachybacterium sp. TaxID=1891286 RepID=UPI002ED411DA
MEDPRQEQSRREREAVLSEYGTWRLTGDEDAPVAAEVGTLETLLRLRDQQQDAPDPGWWTEELMTQLLTEIVPRTVVQPRERVMDMVPTLSRFFTYLVETGRWSPDSMPVTEAPAALAALEFATLEAAEDPSRRSFSTNVLGHGIALGVDLEDDEQLAGYMHWYNSLPDDERVQLSDTGRLPSPTVAFDRERAVQAAREDRRASSSWPWFLPAPEAEDSIALGDLAQGEDLEVYAASRFVRRAAAILELVGEEGVRITSTGALGRADCRALLTDGEGSGPAVRSMWDRPELTGPWITLLDGGWLEIVGGRALARPGPVPYLPLGSDSDGFVEFGHAVLTAALFGKEARDAEDGGFRGMPDTLAALLAACSSSGLALPEPFSEDPGAPEIPWDPATGQWDRDELRRYVAVARDLDDLAAVGILEREGRRFTGSPAVMVALVALIRDQNDPPPEDQQRLL